MVFPDPLARIADEAHPACFQIGHTAEIVVDFQRFGVSVKRVDGEIAARSILFPLGGKGNRGAAAIGGHVAAQRGDLDIAVREDRCDRTVVDAGGDGPYPCILAAIDDLGRMQRGRAIDVVNVLAQQAVAHGSADIARIVRAKRSDELRQIVALRPVCLG